MIGENVSEQHEKVRAGLEASVAQFLANGGEIRDCGGRCLGAAPAQLPVVPRPAAVGQAGDAGAAQPPAAQSGHPGGQDHDSQRSQRLPGRQTRAKNQDALIERIRVYVHTGLSRDAVAKLIGISQQRLTRLVDEHDIDFPK
ncbi:hypothetical protein G7007_20870 [Pseudomonas entomophila]|jgi:hypothetical protein|uniref:hypothetical protein n=1 Tax=Pseudomonas entomophila TaxID=312306 RepID=UPI0015E2CC1B|nr:hypothetical protein [Pseudomonas entomophila]MBA1195280.1 hypothetical protein [Pseudomonas entomophila]